jgi:hypothetical protein
MFGWYVTSKRTSPNGCGARTPELVGDYLALYGPENREHLDGQLREVEQFLRSQLQPTG